MSAGLDGRSRALIPDRRFARLARRHTRVLASLLVATLTASLLWAPPQAVAAPPPGPGLHTPPATSTPVSPVVGTPSAPPAMPVWTAPAQAWPAGGLGTVTVDTTAAGAARTAKPAAKAGAKPAASGVGRVGGLPVVVRGRGDAAVAGDPAGTRSRDQAAPGLVPSAVQVSVADRATTDAAGVRGVLFTLLRADGLTGPSGVALDVDYSGFANAYGGGYGGRLRLVRMPACVLTTPEVPSCQWQTPIDTAVNTPDTQVVSDDVLDVADPAGPAGAGTFPLPPAGTGETVPVRADGQPPNPAAPSAKASSAAGPGTADTSGQPVFALTAGAASDNGDYSQTSLSPTYSWTAGTPGRRVQL